MPTSTWTRLSPVRRERVLVAAMDEFGTHGYSTGSLNVIAREAGVAKGSLFQYFEGKLDLFAYVAEQTSLRVYTAMRPWLDGYDGSTEFSRHLTDALEAWFDYFAGHPLERGVTAATNMELDPAVRNAVRAPVQDIYLAGLRPWSSGRSTPATCARGPTSTPCCPCCSSSCRTSRSRPTPWASKDRCASRANTRKSAGRTSPA